MMERLNRQLMIEGWDQKALDEKPVLLITDQPVYGGLYVLSAAALGVKHQFVIANALDELLIKIAREIEPSLELTLIKGGVDSPYLCEYLLETINPEASIVWTSYNLPKKIVINKSLKHEKPAILSVSDENIKIFNYKKGREYKQLEEILTNAELESQGLADPVSGIITSGILLEETKQELMQKQTTDELISYELANNKQIPDELKEGLKVLIVGAGALGNFVALGLGYLGVKNVHIIDPDVVELHNLNRQVLFRNSVGEKKAIALARELNTLFDLNAEAIVDYFTDKTDIKAYDVIFDCVDNFETRILLSEAVKKQGKTLISGGTNVSSGQVTIYVPGLTRETPAERLGLYEIVKKRGLQPITRERAACVYRPDPSVIMSNEVIGGVMVDVFRKIVNREEIPVLVTYDANSKHVIFQQY